MAGKCLLISGGLLLLLLVLQPQPTSTQSLGPLVPALADQLVSLWQNNELQFMGFQCFYQQNPRIKRWQLYFRGNFMCPGWTAIQGRAETRSRSGVLRDTIEDFLNKITAANLVTADEARAWLGSVQNLRRNNLSRNVQRCYFVSRTMQGKAGVLVMAVVALTSVQMTQAQSWSDLLPAITQQINSLWQNNNLQFMGSECSYVQKPIVKRWQLYFNGRFTCNNFAGITGRSETRSRSGVMSDAIRDFLNKAHAQGLVTEEAVRIWLQGFS
ncbi:uncharacterized protein LOC108676095 [Hyalella azteca]|uniref:Uncharacterized protein LOC108676095 n=1 Tax=Hyalella azteca TaxID=294128 RepID=A0A979FVN0_HYAAZ|nr:uncharacterized protein LOC108676095 [Hyalella azteca]